MLASEFAPLEEPINALPVSVELLVNEIVNQIHQQGGL